MAVSLVSVANPRATQWPGVARRPIVAPNARRIALCSQQGAAKAAAASKARVIASMGRAERAGKVSIGIVD